MPKLSGFSITFLKFKIARSQTPFGNAFLDALRRRTTDLYDAEHQKRHSQIEFGNEQKGTYYRLSK